MNRSSGTKIAGKALACTAAVLLALVLAASWYIGGQTKAIEKYCSSLAAGDLKAYNSVTDGGGRLSAITESAEFKKSCRSLFKALPEFSELDENDVIGCRVSMTSHEMEAVDKWICTYDVYFYCSGMSTAVKDISSDVSFKNGKWIFSEA